MVDDIDISEAELRLPLMLPLEHVHDGAEEPVVPTEQGGVPDGFVVEQLGPFMLITAPAQACLTTPHRPP